MRNTVCIANKISFSCLTLLTPMTEAKDVVDLRELIFIVNRIPIIAGFFRARLAKPVATFSDRLVDKKVLKANKPSLLSDTSLNSSLDIPCPR